MIRTVVFDMGGVLVDLDVAKMIRELAALSALPLDMSQLTAANLLGNGGSNSQLHLYEQGLITTDEFIRGILAAAKPGTTPEQAVSASLSILSGIPQHRLDAIRALRQRGYRTYLLSNINDLHWRHINDTMLHGWEQYFDDVFLSHEVHSTKPDAPIYEALLHSTGIFPAEALYIDDVEANILGGQRYGLQTLLATGDQWLPTVTALPEVAE